MHVIPEGMFAFAGPPDDDPESEDNEHDEVRLLL